MVLGKVRNFMCHNLGADTNANPLAPSQQIHGAKYQWGTASPFVTQAQDREYGDEVTPPGWASVITPNGAWLGDGSKGTSDPCPEGYRVPTSDETNSMLNSNTLKWTGPYETSPTNYFSGMQVISKTSGEFTMFLPAAGYRGGASDRIPGYSMLRGATGNYWTGTNASNPSRANVMSFSSNGNTTPYQPDWAKDAGTPVRCISIK